MVVTSVDKDGCCWCSWQASDASRTIAATARFHVDVLVARPVEELAKACGAQLWGIAV